MNDNEKYPRTNNPTEIGLCILHRGNSSNSKQN